MSCGILGLLAAMMPSTWSQGMGRHEEEKILREIELPSRWADTKLRKGARSLGPTPHSCPAWSSGFRSLVLVDEEYGLSLGESHTSYAGSSCSAEPDFFSTKTWFSDRQDGTIKTHWFLPSNFRSFCPSSFCKVLISIVHSTHIPPYPYSPCP